MCGTKLALGFGEIYETYSGGQTVVLSLHVCHVWYPLVIARFNLLRTSKQGESAIVIQANLCYIVRHVLALRLGFSFVSGHRPTRAVAAEQWI